MPEAEMARWLLRAIFLSSEAAGPMGCAFGVWEMLEGSGSERSIFDLLRAVNERLRTLDFELFQVMALRQVYDRDAGTAFEALITWNSGKSESVMVRLTL